MAIILQVSRMVKVHSTFLFDFERIIGWKITPVLNISQDEREILAWIQHI